MSTSGRPAAGADGLTDDRPAAGPGSGRRRRRRFDRWRLVSPTGAEVISLRQLSKRERLRVTAPSLFTTGNMACGFISVLLAFRQEFAWAAGILFIAIMLDIADGFVARKVGATTPFGVQLDSMADLISFGMAPAVLVHTWALDVWPGAAWSVAFLWLACAAFRLARFNATVDPMDDKRYFVGLPSPAAAAVIIATIFALDTPDIGPRMGQVALLPVIVAIVPALLMITSVRFRSFRNLLSPTTSRAKLTTAVLLLAVVTGLILVPGLTMVAIAYFYVLSAPLGVLTAPLRERVFGVDAVAPPRYRARSVFLPDPDTEPNIEADAESDTDPDAEGDEGPALDGADTQVLEGDDRL